MSELKRLRDLFVWPYPASTNGITCPFGFDENTFETPRFHPACDLSIKPELQKSVLNYPIIAPCNATSTKWWGPRGRSGTTWLDLRFNGGLWRMAHINRDEMDEQARALIIQGLPLDQWQAIAPIGMEGLSIGAFPRHLHLMLYLEPSVENKNALIERWGDNWGPKCDKLPLWAPATNGQMRADGWDWANNHTAGRTDPFDNRQYICVDWFGLLWPEGKK